MFPGGVAAGSVATVIETVTGPPGALGFGASESVADWGDTITLVVASGLPNVSSSCGA